VSNMTPPPTHVALCGEAIRTVRWSPYKKDVRADLSAARTRGLSGPVEVVPVRTFLQRGWALMRDRPADHTVVLLGEDERPVTVDLRPGRGAPAPVREFDRDGRTWRMQPADGCLIHRSISTIASYRPHDPSRGWFSSTCEGGFLVTKEWTEATITAAGPESQQHDAMLVRCERSGRLTDWRCVAQGRDQIVEYRRSSGLDIPYERPNATFGRGFDAWLAQAALWTIRDEDPEAIPVLDTAPGSRTWERFFEEKDALKAERAR
jgi:hypothetical protein